MLARRRCPRPTQAVRVPAWASDGNRLGIEGNPADPNDGETPVALIVLDFDEECARIAIREGSKPDEMLPIDPGDPSARERYDTVTGRWIVIRRQRPAGASEL